MDRNILTILQNCVQTLCETACLAVDAQSAQLHISDSLDPWAVFSVVQNVQRHTLIAPMAEDSRVSLGDFSAVEVMSETSFVSDLVDLHIDLLAEGSQSKARLVIAGAPRSWPSKNRKRCLDQLAGTLSQQLVAMREGPGILASGMLALMEELAELDAGVNTPTLTGFLRLISGRPPTRSQIIALQISGLVDGHGMLAPPMDVSLTATGREIILRSGLRSLPDTDILCSTTLQESTEGGALAVGAEMRPHARLRIMERDYLIAAHPMTDVLHYSCVSDNAWSALSHSNADGWTKVAAEIIQADIDVPYEFVKMHLIRRRDLPTDEIAEAFELLGQVFWLRRVETGLELRLEHAEWSRVDVDPDLPPQDRARAVALHLGRSRTIAVEKAAADWAQRMAHAVQVSPYSEMAAE